MRLGKISQVAASFFQTASKTVKGAAYAPIKKANISINRKMLAELAVTDSEAFAKIAETAKNA